MIPRAMAAKCRLTAKSSSVLLQRIYTTKTKKNVDRIKTHKYI